jgi:integrase
VTGSDTRTQTRRKQIICHQTEYPFTVQNLAGHSDVRLTTQTYAHVQAEALGRAAGVLDRMNWVGGEV